MGCCQSSHEESLEGFDGEMYLLCRGYWMICKVVVPESYRETPSVLFAIDNAFLNWAKNLLTSPLGKYEKIFNLEEMNDREFALDTIETYMTNLEAVHSTLHATFDMKRFYTRFPEFNRIINK